MLSEPISAPRLIFVEDSDPDYERALAALVADTTLGVNAAAVQRVVDEPGLRAALAGSAADAVMADHAPAGFDSLSVLQVTRQFDADLPVLILCGESCDVQTDAALAEGAIDIVRKSRPAQWMPALKRALQADALRRQLRAHQARVRELTVHLERVREEERQALARELHDDVGALLTALKFELSHLARELYGRPAVAPRVRAMQELLAQAFAASHRIQHNLHPPALDAGLPAAIDWLVRGFAGHNGVQTRYESNRDALPLSPSKAVALYRFAQESLNNVARHAQASSVEVTLFATADEVTLEVADDGVGFDPEMLDDLPGLGLRGLVERAGALGGWAEIDSARGRGTTVMLSVPLADEDAEAATRVGVQRHSIADSD